MRLTDRWNRRNRLQSPKRMNHNTLQRLDDGQVLPSAPSIPLEDSGTVVKEFGNHLPRLSPLMCIAISLPIAAGARDPHYRLHESAQQV